MQEVEIREDQGKTPTDRKWVAVLGDTFTDRDGKQARFVQYACVPITALEFIDGKWFADEKILLTEVQNWMYSGRVAISQVTAMKLLNQVDASSVSDTEQPALPSES